MTTTPENRFCLVMCVKDESHIIRRCLTSVANVATSYFICDTGSTDGTQEIIRSFFEERGIPGEVVEHPWKNYGYNKSWVLTQARVENKARDAKYLFWLDADEVWFTDPKKPDETYPTKADADKLFEFAEARPDMAIFQLMTHYGNLEYNRSNMVRNHQLYQWKSPVHEWLWSEGNGGTVVYHEIKLLARSEGKASVNPNKAKIWIAHFLEYIAEQGIENCSREVFYLAQTLSEDGQREKAIEYYKKCIDGNGWSEERYISCLRLGRMLQDPKEKAHYWKRGYLLNKERLECTYELMRLYQETDRRKALTWLCAAPANPAKQPWFLFNESDIYNWSFDLNGALVAFYAGYPALANVLNQRCIKRDNCPPHIMDLLKRNQVYYNPSVVDSRAPKLPTAMIIDNFYSDPDAIRKKALEAEYPIKGNYPGQRSISYATQQDKELFERIMGRKITYWPEGQTSYNGAFQYTIATDRSWIHRDATQFSCVVYLTPNAPANGGTTMYRHKATGLEKTTTKEEDDRLNVDSRNFEAWDIMARVGNKYNRAIIFQGMNSHMSDEYFGSDIHDGRLFQTFFFNCADE